MRRSPGQARPRSRQSVDMDWRHLRGRAPGLEGLSGRIALTAGGTPVGALEIESDGTTCVVADASGAAATITVDSEDTLAGLLRGQLPPIVMELRGRMRIAGDARFALQALYGLQAGSPWAAAFESRGP
jgi:putative sterol carrier protein